MGNDEENLQLRMINDLKASQENRQIVPQLKEDHLQLLPCPTLCNMNRGRMCDPTSQNLIASSSSIGMGDNPNWRSFHQSPDYSMETRNLRRKREPSPLNYSWQKCSRLKIMPKEALGVEERGNPVEETAINQPVSLALPVEKRLGMEEMDQTGDLVEETHHHLRDQKEENRGREGNCDNQICLGKDGKDSGTWKPLQTQAVLNQPISSRNSTEILNP
jgi:hypothetical protein